MNRTLFLYILVPITWCAVFLLPFRAVATQDTGSEISKSPYSVIIKNDPFDQKRGAGDTGMTNGGEGHGAGDIRENYILYGTIISGGVKKAFLKPKKTTRRKPVRTGEKKKSHDQYRTVTEGDFIDGCKVESITSRGIVIASGGHTTTITVFSGNKTGRKANKPVALLTKQPATPESHITGNTDQQVRGKGASRTPALPKKGNAAAKGATRKNSTKTTKLPLFGSSATIRPPHPASAGNGMNIFQQLLQKASEGRTGQNPFGNK